MCSGAQSRGSSQGPSAFSKSEPFAPLFQELRGWLGLRMHHSGTRGKIFRNTLASKAVSFLLSVSCKGRKPDWPDGQVLPKPSRTEGIRGRGARRTHLWMLSTRRNVLQGGNLLEQFYASLPSQDYHKATKNSALYPFFFLFAGVRLLLQDSLQNYHFYPNQSLQQYLSSIQSMAQCVATA